MSQSFHGFRLKAVDFLTLGQYQAYANLTAGGSPAGWALVRTLPPPEPTGLGDQIRARSRERYARPLPDTTIGTRRVATPKDEGSTGGEGGTGGGELGRKWRRP